MRAIMTGLAILALATPAAAESWQAFSRSANSAYLADVDAIVVEGGITRVTLAIVPLRGEAGDFSHTVDTYEFRCGSNQWRSPLSIEFGPDGTEVGRYTDDSDWLSARNGTIPGILKEIACDGIRANPPHWPTINAFVEARGPST